MRIIVGSQRGAKVRAVQRFVDTLGARLWPSAPIEIRTVDVESGVRETPIGREETLRGARQRAEACWPGAAGAAGPVYAVGLEGGLDVLAGEPGAAPARRVFLENWAYVTDGRRGYFGGGGAIAVPEALAVEVLDKQRSLAAVIDEWAGRQDIRSQEGTWGVLTLGYVTREEVFYRALLHAFAPFYAGGRD